MALSVIGAGFGRTGTLSLKTALEILGYAPCYHMVEVFEHPEHIPLWHEATKGAAPWDEIFAGYRATADWPACNFWRQLLDHYPTAKVILTVRDPQKWYDSVRQTIYKATQAAPPDDAPPVRKAQQAMAAQLIWQQTFDGRIEDREHAIAVFERHNADVQATVPPEQLLVFSAAQGWEPLCEFLGCPIPEEPFPNVNSSADFQSRLQQMESP